jgi:hypothetical protein
MRTASSTALSSRLIAVEYWLFISDRISLTAAADVAGITEPTSSATLRESHRRLP